MLLEELGELPLVLHPGPGLASSGAAASRVAPSAAPAAATSAAPAPTPPASVPPASPAASTEVIRPVAPGPSLSVLIAEAPAV